MAPASGARPVCVAPPIAPTGPSAVVVTPPTDPDLLVVTLALVASATEYRITVTLTPGAGARRLHSTEPSQFSVTQRGPDANRFSIVPGVTETDGEGCS